VKRERERGEREGGERERERERGGESYVGKIEDDATFCSYIDKHVSLSVSSTRLLTQHHSGVTIIAISARFAKAFVFVVLELK